MVNLIDFGGSNASFIVVNCTTDELGVVICLKTVNDALVIRLYVHSEI
jgi:hypothetical protein